MKKKFRELDLPVSERKAIREFVRRAKKELGSELITTLLYGSILTPKYNDDSDVDIFLLVRKQTNEVYEIVGTITADIWSKYNVFLSPVTFDEYEQQRNLEIHSPFFENVYKSGIQI